MNADLKECIKSCATRAEYQAAQQPELMEQAVTCWTPGDSELQYLHFNGKNYPVTLDYYSGFFKVDTVPAMTSESAIRRLKPHFSHYGVHVKYLSDNGPQFE